MERSFDSRNAGRESRYHKRLPLHLHLCKRTFLDFTVPHLFCLVNSPTVLVSCGPGHQPICWLVEFVNESKAHSHARVNEATLAWFGTSHHCFGAGLSYCLCLLLLLCCSTLTIIRKSRHDGWVTNQLFARPSAHVSVKHCLLATHLVTACFKSTTSLATLQLRLRHSSYRCRLESQLYKREWVQFGPITHVLQHDQFACHT